MKNQNEGVLQMGKRLDDNDLITIARLTAEGKTSECIAEKIDCCTSTIVNARRRMVVQELIQLYKLYPQELDRTVSKGKKRR